MTLATIQATREGDGIYCHSESIECYLSYR